MSLPNDGKSVILQSVGGIPAWEFYRRHGLALHRKSDLDGITHAVFVHEGELLPTIPAVLQHRAVALDQESIAALALSDYANERGIGIALMQAVAEGFKPTKARLLVLSREADAQNFTVAFKPNKVDEVLGKSEISNYVINTLLKAGQ